MTKRITPAQIVTLKKLCTDSTDNPYIYLMSLANIPTIAYMTLPQASRVSNFMKGVVEAIAESCERDPHKLVTIDTMTTFQGEFYVLKVADVPIKSFIDEYDAKALANFMEMVVTEIVKC